MKECEYKVMFLGETGTGAKTSLINRLIDKKFDTKNESTICPNSAYIFIQNDLGIIKLELWDTPGGKKFRKLNKLFIKGSHCIVLGYDITNQSTFNEINYH